MFHKKKKICFAVCAAALLAGTAIADLPSVILDTAVLPAAASSSEDLIMHYNTSAGSNFSGNAWDNDESFYKALPLGNGRIGAMVYGNCPTERFDLNEATFWSGGPSSNNKPVSADTMEKCWQQMMAGDYTGADGTIANSMIGGGMAKYQSVGTLNLDTGHQNVSDYQRYLNLNTAVAGCSYSYQGKQYRRESFVSHPDQVLVTRISCSEAGGVSLTASYDCSLKDQFTISVSGNDTIVMNGHGDSEYGMPYAVHFSTATKLIPQGGTVSADGNKIKVSGADSILVLTTVRTNFIDFQTVNADEKGMAAADLEAASRKSYQELLDAHEADYTELFSRVDVELGGDGSNNSKTIPQRIAEFGKNNDPKMAELMFQYGRYMMISASRDSEPMNLQGIWNKFRDPAWGCKYTTNINYEMNYWPALTTNLEECFAPFVEKAKSLQVQGAKTAKEVYGVNDGWVVHHNTDLWNHTGPIDGTWGMWPTGGAWISDMLYDAYRFNQDEAYLQEVYPVIEGSAKFLNSIMREADIDGQTYSVVFPSTSPEVDTPKNSGGKGATCAYGITMDNALARALFSDTVEAAQILSRESTFTGTLQNRLNLIKPNTIGSWGQIQEWAYDWDARNEQNRHISHMYDLFPGQLISKGDTAQLAAAAAVSLNGRGDEGTGWSEAWKLNCWARLEDGEHAYNLIKLLISPVNHYGRLYDNLWDAHPPFQIDGNFGLTSGIAEMLLQSQDNEIKLLPALPEQWNTGHANGLCARGGFTVDQEWKNGQLVSASICSKNGNVCTISYGGETISFPTQAGKTYLIDGTLAVERTDTLKNVARGKAVQSSADIMSDMTGFSAMYATDGLESTAAQSNSSSGYLEIDLTSKSKDPDKVYTLCRWDLKLAGVSGDYKDNARSFRLSFSKDHGKTYTDTVEVNGNSKNICSGVLNHIDANYVRVEILEAAQYNKGRMKVNEVEIWGISDEPDPTRYAFETIEAESYDRQSGIQTEDLEDGGADVGYIQNGDYIMFRRMNFVSGAEKFMARAGSAADGGYISLRVDSLNGKEIGRCQVTPTDGWQKWQTFSCDVSGITGVHDLYLVFEGDDGYLMNVDNFSFSTESMLGDLNGDSLVDEEDASMMQKHLLTIQALTKEQAPLADLNQDGVITGVDLSLLKGLYVNL
ncbi:MAG: glycoside hydrolase N-terminal domain-containing protein [Oscillospiraceae bacterium]|nr:glycoside hydrolase N-terminal domain-containing protein [Oscillospiraceae bacterium]